MRTALTLALVLGALALDRAALSTAPGAELLTPSPERTAQIFVMSVAAHRPEQARDRLTTAARQEWSAARIRELDRAWRERDGEYRMADAEESERGERVRLRARFHTARRGIVQRDFTLEREADTALWKIASLEEE